MIQKSTFSFHVGYSPEGFSRGCLSGCNLMSGKSQGGDSLVTVKFTCKNVNTLWFDLFIAQRVEKEVVLWIHFLPLVFLYPWKYPEASVLWCLQGYTLWERPTAWNGLTQFVWCNISLFKVSYCYTKFLSSWKMI